MKKVLVSIVASLLVVTLGSIANAGIDDDWSPDYMQYAVGVNTYTTFNFSSQACGGGWGDYCKGWKSTDSFCITYATEIAGRIKSSTNWCGNWAESYWQDGGWYEADYGGCSAMSGMYRAYAYDADDARYSFSTNEAVFLIEFEYGGDTHTFAMFNGTC